MPWATRSRRCKYTTKPAAHNSADTPSSEKKAKLSSAELRKKKKDRMARRKRGEEVFSDED